MSELHQRSAASRQPSPTHTAPHVGAPSTTTTAQRVPISGAALSHELKEGVHEGIQHAKQLGDEAYRQVCEVKMNWRNYPKLLTSVLLLSCFLLGALTSAGVQKMGLVGGSRHYVSSHWDRETADAHHALDVLLDHMKHPHLYEHAKGQSLIGRARNGLMHVFEAILPTKLTSRGGARDMYEDVREKGRQVYDKMGRPIGRGNIIDKASEVASDLKYSARRTIEDAKDKFGDMTESVFGSDRDEYPGERYVREKVGKTRGGGGGLGSWLGLGKKDRDHEPSRSSWFGSEPNHEEYEGESDEMGMAKKKIRQVVREAERNE